MVRHNIEQHVSVSSNDSSDESADGCNNFLSTCTSQWAPHCNGQLVTGVMTCVFYLLVIAANGGIIVYENVVSDTYRTLINKVVTLMSMYNILLSTSFLPIALSSHFCIQLSSIYCTGNLLVTLTFVLQLILVHNQLAILLNWSTSRVGSIQSINEDIGKRIISTFNSMLSIFLSLIVCVRFGGKATFIYRLCIGTFSGNLCIFAFLSGEH